RPGQWRGRIPRAENSQLDDYVPRAVGEYFPRVPTAIAEAYFDLSEPVKRFFQLQMTLRELAYYVFGILWTLALAAFPGGVITRRAIVQLATETPLGIKDAAMFAGRRYIWYFLAPLYPL